MQEQEKKKPGKPSAFDDIDLRFIRFMARKGLTDQEIADELGIHRNTLLKWKKAHPDFMENLKEWKTEADEEVERSLYQRAIGYSCKETKLFCYEGMVLEKEYVKHYPPDPTAMIFWLKNRKPSEWRDKQEIDLGKGDKSIEVTLAYKRKGEVGK